jgi:hypothetical protein
MTANISPNSVVPQPSDHPLNHYEFPYLRQRQTRAGEPSAWQQELANAIESIFTKGARELDEVVAGLNRSRVRPPNGGDWTAESFQAVMRELGA